MAKKKKPRRRIGRDWFWKVPLLVLALAVLNGVLASRLLWGPVDRLLDALAEGYWPFAEERVRWSVRRADAAEGERSDGGALTASWDGFRFRLLVEAMDREGGLAADGDGTRIWMSGEGRGDFSGGATAFEEMRAAWSDARRAVRGPRRWLLTAAAHPFVTGVSRKEGAWTWRVRLPVGHVFVRGGWPERAHLKLPGGGQAWDLLRERDAEEVALPEREPLPAPAREIDYGLAEAARVLALQAQPVRRERDGEWREGRGILRIRNGRRTALFEGSAYEIGFQHGRLLRDSAERLIRRTLFGVGLTYALEKNVWFPDAARALFERQRPFIDDALIEEMRGFADGSGIPLDLVQAANLFPEFFHCTGAAVFGKATADGRLYHIRVLDYMVHIGLQDEALVAAIRRDGALPFVTVGYAGFIGTVTGMNGSGVAIGEMGGSLEGAWDGVPMSFLMRGVLERAETLEEALAILRESPRTCEFYYVISDAKGPSAAGVYATPEVFDVLRPGEAHPRLPDPVEDAILVSGGRRYRRLVERVREHYGKIDAALLFELCRRPVAMADNLHTVVFDPEALTLWVADAERHKPACDTEPAVYTWADLFGGEEP